ncbi:hypothetical protein B296_00029857 [Ensete ventricosum]|uniref:Uncharacterized protein n=1 Tax=Ensete ventricosum TaxID=4639 RepID=A0A426ZBV8_ENSVE|nr:hypothetical protein B296_00029857 [Ensete ventricosum]
MAVNRRLICHGSRSGSCPLSILVEPLFLYPGEKNCSSNGTELPRLNLPFYLWFESLDEGTYQLSVSPIMTKLEGCPKGVLGGGSKMIGFQWVRKKKEDKGAVADFSSKKVQ